MAVKNAVYKVDNGAGAFDELMFKTKAEQVDIGENSSLKQYLDKVNLATKNDGSTGADGQEGWIPLGNGEKLYFGWFNVPTSSGVAWGSRVYAVPECTLIRNAIVCSAGDYSISLLNLGGTNNKMNVAVYNAPVGGFGRARYFAVGY